MSHYRKPKTINPDEVDPSVYYYDEVYDDMKQEEKEETLKKHGTSSDSHKDTKKDKLPAKYIPGIQKTSEIRKSEKEIRKFKKYARDREEAERDATISKEDVFISASYKRKMKEISELEKERRRRIEEESSNSMNFIKKYKTTTDKDVCGKKAQAEIRVDISERPSDEYKNEHSTARREHRKSASPRESSSRAHHQSGRDHARSSNKLSNESKRNDKDSRRLDKKDILRERRHRLRKILAKRTVGTAFDEAVRLYKERRSNALA